MRENFDSDALKPEAGVRAIWLLFKRGNWGHLEDFGMVRSEAEPVLVQFAVDNLVTDRLTKAQCRKLEQLVPGLREARKEMQLAYILKFYEQGVQLEGHIAELLKEANT